MTGILTHNRSNAARNGVSLMEVLISIGVISLGIFGVASLIPVAQFKVAEGTSRDRQASFGPSAAANFRVRMGSPADWALPNGVPLLSLPANQLQPILNRGFCIDPLGILSPPAALTQFPANAAADVALPRLSLTQLHIDSVTGDPIPQLGSLALARDMFLLKDDAVFRIPQDSGLQPQRQFFVTETIPAVQQRALAPVADASLSWFATLSRPMVGGNDEYILSIVIVKGRAPVLGNLEENFAEVNSPFAGEILLRQPRTANNQFGISDLRLGDWILLARQLDDATPPTLVYRWTQIIGSDELAETTANQNIVNGGFSISNDDFIPPSTPAMAFMMRDVVSVYERTIRLETTGAWN